MLNDSTQNEKKKSDFFSLDFLIKIEETIQDKEIATKNPILNLLFQYWKVEIIITKSKQIKEINFDLKTPNTIGIVFNFMLSYLTSLISKGMQIANTNRNLISRWAITLELKIISSSKISKSIVLVVQIKEIIKILENGIVLNPKGYEIDIIPENIIAIWVLVLNLEKKYKLITELIIITK